MSNMWRGALGILAPFHRGTLHEWAIGSAGGCDTAAIVGPVLRTMSSNRMTSGGIVHVIDAQGSKSPHRWHRRVVRREYRLGSGQHMCPRSRISNTGPVSRSFQWSDRRGLPREDLCHF
jgi:hypothetical protein